MPGSRTPGPTGTQTPSPRPGPTQHRPGPVGVDLRFPTLEIFAALHGDLMVSESRPLTLREIDIARRLMHHAVAHKTIPKGVDDRLVTVKDPAVLTYTEEEVAAIGAQARESGVWLACHAQKLMI